MAIVGGTQGDDCLAFHDDDGGLRDATGSRSRSGLLRDNARTTVHGRLLIVARYRAGWRQAHIAAAMGISRKCVRTWITRFQADGEAGLVDRSSRPRTSPRRTPTEVEDRVVEL